MPEMRGKGAGRVVVSGEHGARPGPCGPAAGPVLALAAGAAGFEAQVLQLVLMRELLTFFSGLEIVIGATLSVWMAFTAAGAFAAGRIPARNPAARLVIALSAAGVWTAVALAAIRVSRGLLGIESGEEPSLPASVLLSMIAAGPSAAFLGAAFPAAAALLSGLGRFAPGRAFLYEAAGGAFAGAVFTFVMAHLLNPFQSAFLASGLALTAAAAAAGRSFRLGGAAAALFGFLLAVAGPLDRATEKARWRDWNEGYSMEETADSKYGRISVLRYRDQTSFFESGHLAFSIPDMESGAELAGMVMVQHRKPGCVLAIGGGISGLAREILRFPVESLDVVELDPKLVELAMRRLPAEERGIFYKPGVRMHYADGRLFVKRSDPESFDLVLICLPDPSTASLNRFYTREFFEEVGLALRPGGVCAFTLSSAENYLGSELLLRNGTEYHTFLSVFPHVRVVPGDPAIFLGSRDPSYLSLDPDVLADRLLERRPELAGEGGEGRHGWFSPHHYHMRLGSGDPAEVNRQLRTWPAPGSAGEPEGGGPRPLPSFLSGGRDGKDPWDEDVPEAERTLNSDQRPGASLATLLVWARKMGHPLLADALRGLSSLPVAFLALPGLLLLVPALALRAAGRPGGAAGWSAASAVFAVGLAEMVFELSVLYSFQGYYGYVYGEMGFLFAVFMAGLASGSWVSGRWFAERGRPAFVPALLLCCIAGSVCLPWALAAAGSAGSPAIVLSIFSLLTFLSGLPVGLLFPHASASGEGGLGRASSLYAADLAGGIAGALAAAPLLIPCAGLSATLRVFVPAILAAALIAHLASACRTPGREIQPPPPL